MDTPKNPFQEPPEVQEPSSKEMLLQREKELLGFYLTGHPMDRYQKILSRLSCVPFSDFPTLSENAVVRVAFVVEKVEVKISNKTQKKFVILTISDGLERLELPIWSEMYEEKVTLLKENQLLYAILQMERRGGSVSFSCRYLNELAVIDEAELRACDDVYDKLMRSAKNGEAKWKTANKEKTTPAAEKEIVSLLRIKIDAEKVRLSHILQMKQLFRANPGKSPIELYFHSQSKKIGCVSVDPNWGVKMSPSLIQQLKALSLELSTFSIV